MSTTGLFISLIVVAAFVLWVALPFFRGERRPDAELAAADRQRERLLIYYERVLRNLHDIDEDHATGKLTDHDYAEERERWVQRGIHTLRTLDELGEQHLIAPASTDDAGIDEAIDRAIEAAIKSHLDKSTSA
jgi:hypothetical protein